MGRRQLRQWSRQLSLILVVGSVPLVNGVASSGGGGGGGRRPPPPPPLPPSSRRRPEDDSWQYTSARAAHGGGPNDGYYNDVDDDAYWDQQPIQAQQGYNYLDDKDGIDSSSADKEQRKWDDYRSSYEVGSRNADPNTSYRNNGGAAKKSSSQMPPPPPPPQSYDENYLEPYVSRLPLSFDSFSTPQQQLQPPPPQSRSSSGSTIPLPPIHYEFGPATAANVDDLRNDGIVDGDDIDSDDVFQPSISGSARRDLVTRYWSTRMGKAQIMAISAFLGAALGRFLSKSLIPVGGDALWATVFALALWISTWFRTPLGELTRAVGLSLLLVLQRMTRIRRDYPTWQYIPAALGLRRVTRGLRPFPPTRNPWRYTPRSDRDPDFNMTYAMVAMAFVGSACGGNLPFIPTWIGALAGAGMFVLACTWLSPRGDLARTCGMRVVSTAGQLWEIQADLQIIPKATVVSSQIIDRAMILDRKHKVKDKFLALASRGYDQATRVAAQIQQQQRGGNNKLDDDDRERTPRYDGDGDRSAGRGQIEEQGRTRYKDDNAMPRREQEDRRPRDDPRGREDAFRSPRDVRNGDRDRPSPRPKRPFGDVDDHERGRDRRRYDNYDGEKRGPHSSNDVDEDRFHPPKRRGWFR